MNVLSSETPTCHLYMNTRIGAAFRIETEIILFWTTLYFEQN